MANENEIAKPAEKGTEAPAPQSSDNLQAFRSGDAQTQPVAANTSTEHLPTLNISDDAKPFNPYNLPGDYDKKDVAYAKENFDPTQVKQLEKEGPKAFHNQMDVFRNAPAGNDPNQPEERGTMIAEKKEDLNIMKPSFENHYGK